MSLLSTESSVPEITHDQPMDLKRARENVDKKLITMALSLTRGNVSQASRVLNISRNSLMDLVKKYQLQ